MKFNSRILIAAALLLLPQLPAFAEGSTSFPNNVTDPTYIAGKKAIEAKDWKKAIDIFKGMRADADTLNYLGYAYRNLGNYDDAFNNYKRALVMDPDHRGANEYIGEAYLLTNNLAMAERHLAALNRICGQNCEEYKDLAKDIAEYKKKH
jgi:tetratricopeptide (TPR) repeat protein